VCPFIYFYLCFETDHALFGFLIFFSFNDYSSISIKINICNISMFYNSFECLTHSFYLIKTRGVLSRILWCLLTTEYRERRRTRSVKCTDSTHQTARQILLT
jgi:hypothetical protein